MTAYFRRNPLLTTLAALAAVLAVVLVAELVSLQGEADRVVAKRGIAADAKLLPPVPAVVPEQAYPETAARPLFIATRRPAPDIVAAATPAFQRGQFSLTGVIVTPQARTVMLREKSTGKTHRAEVGGELNGMKIIQIDPTQVVLGMGDEREVVPLTVQRAGAPGGPAAPPPAAALTQGPFAPAAVPPAAPAPGTVPPFPQQPAGASGLARPAAPPPAPGAAAPPAAAPGVPPAAPPGAQPSAAAPMTPEELLARRRARRGQQTQ